MENNKMSRRSFFGNAAVLTVGAGAVVSACAGEGKGEAAAIKNTPLPQLANAYIPELPDKATDGATIKCGVIGCGGRGSGAAFDFLNAADNVTITALGDVFADRLNGLRENLKKNKNIDIPDDKCFIGFDAYKKVIDSDVDVVILATPPGFRPEHFRYAVEKGKHSFLEKPILVDPAGYRTVIAASKQADAKKLCVVTGTQRRHQRSYVESFKQIQAGVIGEITGGNVYWNQSMLWYRERNKEWSDMEWMIRDWVNWTWLSGDHIVEQHVHNIDVFNWMTGKKCVKATGFGSRQRRITGNQYDFFSVDFEYEGGIHMHSMSRQIDGCSNNVSEFIQGTKGSWSSADMTIRDLQGNVIWKYDGEAEGKQYKQTNPYVLEHVDLINHIRAKKPLNEAEATANSTLCGIMGRESAYTGKTVTWDEMSASPQNMIPETLELGKMDMEKYSVIPVPGTGR